MATNIAARIRGVLGSRSSNLVAVPEIQNDSTNEAIHKLQVQIFELSDELMRQDKRLEAVEVRRR